MIFARDCASNSLRPDVLKIQSKISLITHLHCNPCIAASRVGSVNIRLSIQWIVATGRQLFASNSHGNWAEDEFYPCSNRDLERCRAPSASLRKVVARDLVAGSPRLALAAMNGRQRLMRRKRRRTGRLTGTGAGCRARLRETEHRSAGSVRPNWTGVNNRNNAFGE
jgi:hypothetical protein